MRHVVGNEVKVGAVRVLVPSIMVVSSERLSVWRVRPPGRALDLTSHDQCTISMAVVAIGLLVVLLITAVIRSQ